jgi:ribosomal protein S18 acetylase RimI-like enzyme
MMADSLVYQLSEEPYVKFLLGHGKQLRGKVQGFPLTSELASSGLLVVFVVNNNYAIAACGIRSIFNILVLYVEEGYRGRGFGSEVLAKTIDVAQNRGLNFITLSVSLDNITAFHLYSKFGFKEVACLEEPNLVLMMIPLNLKGRFVFEFLKDVCSLLPNLFLKRVHGWFYKRTIREG